VNIRTGQTFLLRADNPEDKPSWELLEMQWNLLRVAAICGAADVTEDYYDDTEPEGWGYGETVAAKRRAVYLDKGKGVDHRGGEQSEVKQDNMPGDSDSESSDDVRRPGDSSRGAA
jgi:hypothetical protein